MLARKMAKLQSGGVALGYSTKEAETRDTDSFVAVGQPVALRKMYRSTSGISSMVHASRPTVKAHHSSTRLTFHRSTSGRKEVSEEDGDTDEDFDESSLSHRYCLTREKVVAICTLKGVVKRWRSSLINAVRLTHEVDVA